MLFGRWDEMEAVPVGLMVRRTAPWVTPSGEATLAAERVAVELAGAPVSVIWTVCLKPPMGVMMMVVCAVAPCGTVWEVGAKLREKSGGMAGVIVMGRPAEVEVEKVAAPP